MMEENLSTVSAWLTPGTSVYLAFCMGAVNGFLSIGGAAPLSALTGFSWLCSNMPVIWMSPFDFTVKDFETAVSCRNWAKAKEIREAYLTN